MRGGTERKQSARVAPVLGIVLAGLLVLSTPALALDRNRLLDQANLLLLPRERSLPALELTDEEGQRFTTEQLLGRWHLIFFGFTFCPDVCPTTLSDMRRLLRSLPADTRDQLQLVMVTADPARDTPDKLKSYLSYYRAGFKGLTGTMDTLQQLSRSLGLPFVPAGRSEGNYNVSHSGNIAIIGPDGTLRGHIRAPLNLDGLREALPDVIAAE
ncbi:SCO family protein [Pseudomonas sp. PS1]|uniref:SCO family protein n=1 Tax=Stutzerimonas marianensis TaxID=2929513 RepID=A0A9X2ARD0_9GAMM|nr:SCO family protein [Pseudomonas marianensis]MCJ0973308.1 SCO family protein [Pseudomonas marianensis]